MDVSELEKKLLGAARRNPPREQVPYAFEKRVMANLTTLPKFDEWAWWGRALWHGAAGCVIVSLLLSGWSFLPRNAYTAGNGAADLEDVVLASVDEPDLSW